MRLAHNSHLAYCTNVHPGNDWEQTFHSLQNDVLAVRNKVCPDDAYAIGLRLSASAAKELSDPQTYAAFQRWLDENQCYVFTINGFPYGNFHGQRVKEQVYRPDWSSNDRREYTELLFDLLVPLLPNGVSGSVSTVPGSFKPFEPTQAEVEMMFQNLYQTSQYMDRLAEKSGHDLHLGLEPEPLCLFETTPETLTFFDKLLHSQGNRELLLRRVGVNYDTCHLALEYENATGSLRAYADEGVRISKLHLSSALKVKDFSEATLSRLEGFCEPTYLHQVIARNANDSLTRFTDLPDALKARRSGTDLSEEWRIHFHIPLHAEPQSPLLSTADHLLGALDVLAEQPSLCQHLEMETYTWAVMPSDLHSSKVVDQVTREYQWLLPELEKRKLVSQ